MKDLSAAPRLYIAPRDVRRDLQVAGLEVESADAGVQLFPPSGTVASVQCVENCCSSKRG